jgi:hypothetical protein
VKNAVFLDVAQCGTSYNRRFGGTCRLQHQGGKNSRAKNNVNSLLVTSNAVPCSRQHGLCHFVLNVVRKGN